jgi:hypothetical protein
MFSVHISAETPAILKEVRHHGPHCPFRQTGDVTSIRPRLLPSISIHIHHSSVILPSNAMWSQYRNLFNWTSAKSTQKFIERNISYLIYDTRAQRHNRTLDWRTQTTPQFCLYKSEGFSCTKQWICVLLENIAVVTVLRSTTAYKSSSLQIPKKNINLWRVSTLILAGKARLVWRVAAGWTTKGSVKLAPMFRRRGSVCVCVCVYIYMRSLVRLHGVVRLIS